MRETWEIAFTDKGLIWGLEIGTRIAAMISGMTSSPRRRTALRLS